MEEWVEGGKVEIEKEGESMLIELKKKRILKGGRKMFSWGDIRFLLKNYTARFISCP